MKSNLKCVHGTISGILFYLPQAVIYYQITYIERIMVRGNSNVSAVVAEACGARGDYFNLY